MRHWFFALILQSLAQIACAQTVAVSGKVIDRQTEEAIPFASVFIPGTGTGVVTDYDGKYNITVNLPADSIGASSIGYTKLIRKISSAPVQVINFVLDRADYNIQEVVITPGENPALVIMRKVVANKKSHNKQNLNSYGYEAYNKIEIDLNDLNEKFQDRKVFKPFKFIFDNIDSTSEAKPFLPFFLSETVSDFYYRKKPEGRREIIKASKVSGVNDVTISQFLGNMYVEIDVYEDWIKLLQRQFVSPLSQIGMSSYRYYLIDSQMIDNFWCYKIQFFPKTKGGLTFDGDMWIADSVWAIKQISMKMNNSADVNFVRSMSLFNDFLPVRAGSYADSAAGNTAWMLRKEKLIVEFIKPKDAPGLIGRKTSSYKNFTINADEQILDSLFKAERQDVVVRDSATLHDQQYWASIRHDTLTINEQKVYNMIDSLRDMPIVKTYLKVIQTMYLGYYDIGPISIGNIWQFISYNDVEGWRFKFGLSTSNKFSKRIMLGAYIAYGLRDRKIKYGAEMLWLIRKPIRESISVKYRFDMSTTSNYNQFYGNPGLLANFGLRRVENGAYIPIKILEIRELKVDFYKEFKVGYSFDIGFTNRYLKPLGAFDFTYATDTTDLQPNTLIKSAGVSEFTITQRFAWQEKFVSGEFNRVSLGSKYPIVFFQYAAGIKRVMNGAFDYHRFVAGISDNQPLGPLGRVWFIAEAGKTLGRLPFLFLHMPDAPESYIYYYTGFNTVRDYEFVADRYVKLIVEHHLGGLLFNRIPGVRKLKLREVWSARMWWGDLTPENYAANYQNMRDNPSNTGIVQLRLADKMPLFEVTAGIENILRVLRIDVVWRLTHTDPRGGAFSFRYGNFGVRGSLQLQF